MAGHVARMEEGRRRWEDNIRIDLKEIGNNTRNWVDSSHCMYYWSVFMNAALKLRIPKALG